MGVESYLLSSTLRAVLAQRLVRQLCLSCREAYQPSKAELKAAGLAPDTNDQPFYRPTGCTQCRRTGYQGRIGIYELMTVTPELRDMIHEDVDEAQLNIAAFAHHDTLFAAGIARVLSGETSLSEVIRVSRKDGVGHGEL